MKIFDSHAHYDDEKFNQDVEQVLQKIQQQGVNTVISAGYSLESSQKSIQLSKKYNFIYSTCGISPNDIPNTIEELNEQLAKLEQLLSTNTKVIAIGEIGLDYYWNKDNKQLQQTAFIQQIELANKYNLPIVIHTREAIEDTINIIKKVKPIKYGVFHCCPLNVELVKQALKLGFYISFAGPITFKNSKNADEIIQMVLLDKMLIETDSPYLSPEPKRGTRNDSGNLIYIIEKISKIKNLTNEKIASNTHQNAINIFNIK